MGRLSQLRVGFLGLSIFLVVLIAHSEGAPVQETSVSRYANEKGCYYMSKLYPSGDKIQTNEPCLNCTCIGNTLMCYLRVCPFVKPIGENCITEQHVGECCPKFWCPEVYPRSTTETPDTEPRGCYLDGRYYDEGARIPMDPMKPCEVCYCIRNTSVCTVQECELKVDGCFPQYKAGSCCPSRYNCTEEAATTIPPGVMEPEDYEGCKVEGVLYKDGEQVPSEDNCENCYCMKHEVVCAVHECQAPADNCIPEQVEKGQCCPTKYECPPTTEIPVWLTSRPPSLKNISESEIEDDLLTTVDDTDSRLSTIFTEQDAESTTTHLFSDTPGKPGVVDRLTTIIELSQVTTTPIGLITTEISELRTLTESTENATFVTGDLVSRPREPKITEVPDDLFTSVTPAKATGRPVFYPSRPIPGEGICRHENKTFQNKQNVPSADPCRLNCTCFNSVVHCELVECMLSPPESGTNCKVKKLSGECCPKYVCDTPGDTTVGDEKTTTSIMVTDEHEKQTVAEKLSTTLSSFESSTPVFEGTTKEEEKNLTEEAEDLIKLVTSIGTQELTTESAEAHEKEKTEETSTEFSELEGSTTTEPTKETIHISTDGVSMVTRESETESSSDVSTPVSVSSTISTEESEETSKDLELVRTKTTVESVSERDRTVPASTPESTTVVFESSQTPLEELTTKKTIDIITTTFASTSTSEKKDGIQSSTPFADETSHSEMELEKETQASTGIYARTTKVPTDKEVESTTKYDVPVTEKTPSAFDEERQEISSKTTLFTTDVTATAEIKSSTPIEVTSEDQKTTSPAKTTTETTELLEEEDKEEVTTTAKEITTVSSFEDRTTLSSASTKSDVTPEITDVTSGKEEYATEFEEQSTTVKPLKAETTVSGVTVDSFITSDFHDTTILKEKTSTVFEEKITTISPLEPETLLSTTIKIAVPSEIQDITTLQEERTTIKPLKAETTVSGTTVDSFVTSKTHDTTAFKDEFTTIAEEKTSTTSPLEAETTLSSASIKGDITPEVHDVTSLKEQYTTEFMEQSTTVKPLKAETTVSGTTIDRFVTTDIHDSTTLKDEFTTVAEEKSTTTSPLEAETTSSSASTKGDETLETHDVTSIIEEHTTEFKEQSTTAKPFKDETTVSGTTVDRFVTTDIHDSTTLKDEFTTVAEEKSTTTSPLESETTLSSASTKSDLTPEIHDVTSLKEELTTKFKEQSTTVKPLKAEATVSGTTVDRFVTTDIHDSTTLKDEFSTVAEEKSTTTSPLEAETTLSSASTKGDVTPETHDVTIIKEEHTTEFKEQSTTVKPPKAETTVYGTTADRFVTTDIHDSTTLKDEFTTVAEEKSTTTSPLEAETTLSSASTKGDVTPEIQDITIIKEELSTEFKEQSTTIKPLKTETTVPAKATDGLVTSEILYTTTLKEEFTTEDKEKSTTVKPIAVETIAVETTAISSVKPEIYDTTTTKETTIQDEISSTTEMLPQTVEIITDVPIKTSISEDTATELPLTSPEVTSDDGKILEVSKTSPPVSQTEETFTKLGVTETSQTTVQAPMTSTQEHDLDVKSTVISETKLGATETTKLLDFTSITDSSTVKSTTISGEKDETSSVSEAVEVSKGTTEIVEEESESTSEHETEESEISKESVTSTEPKLFSTETASTILKISEGIDSFITKQYGGTSYETETTSEFTEAVKIGDLITTKLPLITTFADVASAVATLTTLTSDLSKTSEAPLSEADYGLTEEDEKFETRDTSTSTTQHGKSTILPSTEFEETSSQAIELTTVQTKESIVTETSKPSEISTKLTTVDHEVYTTEIETDSPDKHKIKFTILPQVLEVGTTIATVQTEDEETGKITDVSSEKSTTHIPIKISTEAFSTVTKLDTTVKDFTKSEVSELSKEPITDSFIETKITSDSVEISESSESSTVLPETSLPPSQATTQKYIKTTELSEPGTLTTSKDIPTTASIVTSEISTAQSTAEIEKLPSTVVASTEETETSRILDIKTTTEAEKFSVRDKITTEEMLSTTDVDLVTESIDAAETVSIDLSSTGSVETTSAKTTFEVTTEFVANITDAPLHTTAFKEIKSQTSVPISTISELTYPETKSTQPDIPEGSTESTVTFSDVTEQTETKLATTPKYDALTVEPSEISTKEETDKKSTFVTTKPTEKVDTEFVTNLQDKLFTGSMSITPPTTEKTDITTSVDTESKMTTEKSFISSESHTFDAQDLETSSTSTMVPKTEETSTIMKEISTMSSGTDSTTTVTSSHEKLTTISTTVLDDSYKTKVSTSFTSEPVSEFTTLESEEELENITSAATLVSESTTPVAETVMFTKSTLPPKILSATESSITSETTYKESDTSITEIASSTTKFLSTQREETTLISIPEEISTKTYVSKSTADVFDTTEVRTTLKSDEDLEGSTAVTKEITDKLMPEVTADDSVTSHIPDITHLSTDTEVTEGKIDLETESVKSTDISISELPSTIESKFIESKTTPGYITTFTRTTSYPEIIAKSPITEADGHTLSTVISDMETSKIDLEEHKSTFPPELKTTVTGEKADETTEHETQTPHETDSSISALDLDITTEMKLTTLTDQLITKESSTSLKTESTVSTQFPVTDTDKYEEKSTTPSISFSSTMQEEISTHKDTISEIGVPEVTEKPTSVAEITSDRTKLVETTMGPQQTFPETELTKTSPPIHTTESESVSETIKPLIPQTTEFVLDILTSQPEMKTTHTSITEKEYDSTEYKETVPSLQVTEKTVTILAMETESSTSNYSISDTTDGVSETEEPRKITGQIKPKHPEITITEQDVTVKPTTQLYDETTAEHDYKLQSQTTKDDSTAIYTTVGIKEETITTKEVTAVHYTEVTPKPTISDDTTHKIYDHTLDSHATTSAFDASEEPKTMESESTISEHDISTTDVPRTTYFSTESSETTAPLTSSISDTSQTPEVKITSIPTTLKSETDEDKDLPDSTELPTLDVGKSTVTTPTDLKITTSLESKTPLKLTTEAVSEISPTTEYGKDLGTEQPAISEKVSTLTTDLLKTEIVKTTTEVELDVTTPVSPIDLDAEITKTTEYDVETEKTTEPSEFITEETRSEPSITKESTDSKFLDDRVTPLYTIKSSTTLGTSSEDAQTEETTMSSIEQESALDVTSITSTLKDIETELSTRETIKQTTIMTAEKEVSLPTSASETTISDAIEKSTKHENTKLISTVAEGSTDSPMTKLSVSTHVMSETTKLTTPGTTELMEETKEHTSDVTEHKVTPTVPGLTITEEKLKESTVTEFTPGEIEAVEITSIKPEEVKDNLIPEFMKTISEEEATIKIKTTEGTTFMTEEEEKAFSTTPETVTRVSDVDISEEKTTTKEIPTSYFTISTASDQEPMDTTISSLDISATTETDSKLVTPIFEKKEISTHSTLTVLDAEITTIISVDESTVKEKPVSSEATDTPKTKLQTDTVTPKTSDVDVVKTTVLPKITLFAETEKFSEEKVTSTTALPETTKPEITVVSEEVLLNNQTFGVDSLVVEHSTTPVTTSEAESEKDTFSKQTIPTDSTSFETSVSSTSFTTAKISEKDIIPDIEPVTTETSGTTPKDMTTVTSSGTIVSSSTEDAVTKGEIDDSTSMEKTSKTASTGIPETLTDTPPPIETQTGFEISTEGGFTQKTTDEKTAPPSSIETFKLVTEGKESTETTTASASTAKENISTEVKSTEDDEIQTVFTSDSETSTPVSILIETTKVETGVTKSEKSEVTEISLKSSESSIQTDKTTKAEGTELSTSEISVTSTPGSMLTDVEVDRKTTLLHEETTTAVPSEKFTTEKEILKTTRIPGSTFGSDTTDRKTQEMKTTGYDETLDERHGTTLTDRIGSVTVMLQTDLVSEQDRSTYPTQDVTKEITHSTMIFSEESTSSLPITEKETLETSKESEIVASTKIVSDVEKLSTPKTSTVPITEVETSTVIKTVKPDTSTEEIKLASTTILSETTTKPLIPEDIFEDKDISVSVQTVEDTASTPVTTVLSQTTTSSEKTTEVESQTTTDEKSSPTYALEETFTKPISTLVDELVVPNTTISDHTDLLAKISTLKTEEEISTTSISKAVTEKADVTTVGSAEASITIEPASPVTESTSSTATTTAGSVTEVVTKMLTDADATLDQEIEERPSTILYSTEDSGDTVTDDGTSEMRICLINGTIYEDGEPIVTAERCEKCHCVEGVISCFKIICKLPKQGCLPDIYQGDECCPSTYKCPSETNVTEYVTTTSTQKFTEKDLTTPIPISFMFSTVPTSIYSTTLVTKSDDVSTEEGTLTDDSSTTQGKSSSTDKVTEDASKELEDKTTIGISSETSSIFTESATMEARVEETSTLEPKSPVFEQKLSTLQTTLFEEKRTEQPIKQTTEAEIASTILHTVTTPSTEEVGSEGDYDESTSHATSIPEDTKTEYSTEETDRKHETTFSPLAVVSTVGTHPDKITETTSEAPSSTTSHSIELKTTMIDSIDEKESNETSLETTSTKTHEDSTSLSTEEPSKSDVDQLVSTSMPSKLPKLDDAFTTTVQTTVKGSTSEKSESISLQTETYQTEEPSTSLGEISTEGTEKDRKVTLTSISTSTAASTTDEATSDESFVTQSERTDMTKGDVSMRKFTISEAETSEIPHKTSTLPPLLSTLKPSDLTTAFVEDKLIVTSSSTDVETIEGEKTTETHMISTSGKQDEEKETDIGKERTQPDTSTPTSTMSVVLKSVDLTSPDSKQTLIPSTITDKSLTTEDRQSTEKYMTTTAEDAETEKTSAIEFISMATPEDKRFESKTTMLPVTSTEFSTSKEVKTSEISELVTETIELNATVISFSKEGTTESANETTESATVSDVSDHVSESTDKLTTFKEKSQPTPTTLPKTTIQLSDTRSTDKVFKFVSTRFTDVAFSTMPTTSLSSETSQDYDKVSTLSTEYESSRSDLETEKVDKDIIDTTATMSIDDATTKATERLTTITELTTKLSVTSTTPISSSEEIITTKRPSIKSLDDQGTSDTPYAEESTSIQTERDEVSTKLPLTPAIVSQITQATTESVSVIDVEMSTIDTETSQAVVTEGTSRQTFHDASTQTTGKATDAMKDGFTESTVPKLVTTFTPSVKFTLPSDEGVTVETDMGKTLQEEVSTLSPKTVTLSTDLIQTETESESKSTEATTYIEKESSEELLKSSEQTSTTVVFSKTTLGKEEIQETTSVVPEITSKTSIETTKEYDTDTTTGIKDKELVSTTTLETDIFKDFASTKTDASLEVTDVTDSELSSENQTSFLPTKQESIESFKTTVIFRDELDAESSSIPSASVSEFEERIQTTIAPLLYVSSEKSLTDSTKPDRSVITEKPELGTLTAITEGFTESAEAETVTSSEKVTSRTPSIYIEGLVSDTTTKTLITDQSTQKEATVTTVKEEVYNLTDSTSYSIPESITQKTDELSSLKPIELSTKILSEITTETSMFKASELITLGVTESDTPKTSEQATEKLDEQTTFKTIESYSPGLAEQSTHKEIQPTSQTVTEGIDVETTAIEKTELTTPDVTEPITLNVSESSTQKESDPSTQASTKEIPERDGETTVTEKTELITTKVTEPTTLKTSESSTQKESELTTETSIEGISERDRETTASEKTELTTLNVTEPTTPKISESSTEKESEPTTQTSIEGISERDSETTVTDKTTELSTPKVTEPTLKVSEVSTPKESESTTQKISESTTQKVTETTFLSDNETTIGKETQPSTVSELSTTKATDLPTKAYKTIETTPLPLTTTDSTEKENATAPVEDDDFLLDDGSCIFEGRIYQSAEQIPRSDACEFCFCFRGDIICLQQSCPPPAPNCHRTMIPGYCCPRYDCPVLVTSRNLTSLTRRKGVQPIIIQKRIEKRAIRAPIEVKGCQINGTFYQVGHTVAKASGPCLHCMCEEGGNMRCDPQKCKPQAPLMLKMNNSFFRTR